MIILSIAAIVIIIILIAAAAILLTPLIHVPIPREKVIVKQSLPVNGGTVQYRQNEKGEKDLVFIDKLANPPQIIF